MSDRLLRSLKKTLRLLMTVGMVFIGIQHFRAPAPFVAIVPAWLPNPLLLVYISGFFEILGGLGLVMPKTRRAAAWGLIALFVAVFPANINMAVNHIGVDGQQVEPWILWTRLPMQAVLIAWAYWLTRPDPAPVGRD